MQPDSDLVAVVDDLLRTDPRLLAAAALVGRVAVVVSEPKPERVRNSTAKKRPPPRLEVGERAGTTTITFHAADAEALREAAAALREVSEQEEAPRPLGAPWLKAARAQPVNDAIRAAIGGQWLAVVKVDGSLFAKLRLEDQRRALALALRGLRHEEREDGSDKVAREAPPLQCWPDTADDLSHLVAALGPDGAEGAAAVKAAEGIADKPTTFDEEVRGLIMRAAHMLTGLHGTLAIAQLVCDRVQHLEEQDLLDDDGNDNALAEVVAQLERLVEREDM